jgi:hypothetical protein
MENTILILMLLGLESALSKLKNDKKNEKS